MRIDSYSKDLATAATAENLIADVGGAQWKYAREVLIRCPNANTSDLLVGNETRQAFTIIKNSFISLSDVIRAGQSGKYDLSKIFVKAGTNADDVEILLIDPSSD